MPRKDGRRHTNPKPSTLNPKVASGGAQPVEAEGSGFQRCGVAPNPTYSLLLCTTSPTPYEPYLNLNALNPKP